MWVVDPSFALICFDPKSLLRFSIFPIPRIVLRSNNEEKWIG